MTTWSPEVRARLKTAPYSGEYHHRHYVEVRQEDRDAALAEIDRLTARNEALEKLLMPFAERGQYWDDARLADDELEWDSTVCLSDPACTLDSQWDLTIRDFREAWDALTPPQPHSRENGDA